MPFAVDRTDEFYEIVRQLQKGKKQSQDVVKTTPKPTASEFTKASGIISRHIEVTANKLSQLTRLVKNSSMFNDSTNDINRLSQSIKNDMSVLKGDIEALSTKLGLSGAKGSQARQHSVHLVNNLKTQLGKQSKVFQDVLQDRAKSLKDQQARRFRMGVANTPGTALGRPMVFGQQNEGGHAGETVSELRDRRAASPKSSVQRKELDPNDKSRRLADAPLRLQEQQMISNYTESRAQAVETINTTMNELGTMFSQLMEMIEFQGQDIQRIDDDVSDIENNLSAGLTELQTTYNNSSNKMLMMKIFGIFMAFMVIFILFFA